MFQSKLNWLNNRPRREKIASIILGTILVFLFFISVLSDLSGAREFIREILFGTPTSTPSLTPLPTADLIVTCPITSIELITATEFVIGETASIAANIPNPPPNITVRFEWAANHGTFGGGKLTSAPNNTYMALQEGFDSISVQLVVTRNQQDIPACREVKASRTIRVFPKHNEVTSTATVHATETPTVVPTTETPTTPPTQTPAPQLDVPLDCVVSFRQDLPDSFICDTTSFLVEADVRNSWNARTARIVVPDNWYVVIYYETYLPPDYSTKDETKQGYILLEEGENRLHIGGHIVFRTANEPSSTHISEDWEVVHKVQEIYISANVPGILEITANADPDPDYGFTATIKVED
jgi:hypothetical protein